MWVRKKHPMEQWIRAFAPSFAKLSKPVDEWRGWVPDWSQRDNFKSRAAGSVVFLFPSNPHPFYSVFCQVLRSPMLCQPGYLGVYHLQQVTSPFEPHCAPFHQPVYAISVPQRWFPSPRPQACGGRCWLGAGRSMQQSCPALAATCLCQ